MRPPPPSPVTFLLSPPLLYGIVTTIMIEAAMFENKRNASKLWSTYGQ